MIVFITGATSGFGRATARRFARDGAALVIAGRRTERLTALADELAVPVHALALDVRDRAAVEDAVTGLPNAFTEVDVLVNNAGLALGIAPAHEASLDDWETMVDTNVKGLMYVTRALLPAMVARGTGHVINVGSTAGGYAYPGSNVYGGTKAFVKQLSMNLRADLAGTGVRVTDVAPGLAETEFSVVRLHGDTEAADAVYAGTDPLTPDDVAETIAWVASRPPHVNVNRIELMPTCQTWGSWNISRRG